MKTLSFLSTVFLCQLLTAHTVVISSLPDNNRPMESLNSANGTALPLESEVRVGAFPGLTSANLIDAAAAGGLTQIEAHFVQFGETLTIGTGAEASAGVFEIVVRETTTDSAVSWNGEVISLLITSPDSSEFLVAQFPNEQFSIDSPTGLESLLSLHLGDASLVLGQNLGEFSFNTSRASERPSFTTWINQYASITDSTLRALNADPDNDGRSNFLEYATGGNPASANDLSPTSIVVDSEGLAWFRVSVSAGIGLNQFQLQSATEIDGPWTPSQSSVSADPSPPVTNTALNWLRFPILADQPVAEFFRLRAVSGEE